MSSQFLENFKALNEKIDSFNYKSSEGESFEVTDLLKKFEKSFYEVTLELRTKIDNMKRARYEVPRFETQINNFKVTDKKCIIYFVVLYRCFLSTCSQKTIDILYPSMLKLLDEINNFKYENNIKLSEEQNRGYVEALKRDYKRNLESYKQYIKDKYLTPEKNNQAIDMGFLDLKEAIDLFTSLIRVLPYLRDSEGQSRFYYGRGKLSINGSEIGYNFDGLMFIFEGSVLKNLSKLFEFEYTFERIVKYQDIEEYQNISGRHSTTVDKEATY